MNYRVTYKDRDDATTEVWWYAYNETDNTPYDFCGQANPLEIELSGDRYSGLRGSKATVRIIIENDAQKAELDKVLGSSYCLQVKKEGITFWVGKLNPQFFEEPYKDYPILVELYASDHIGQFDQKQMLLTDFRIPHDWENPEYSLMDVLNKMLTTEDIIPDGATDLCAPPNVNIASRIYTAGLERQLFEHTYIDPRVFVSEGGKPVEYEDKEDMLNSILNIFQLKLFQWEGEWWLISLDAQWNAGEIIYRKYSLDRDVGWTFISQHTINPDIIALCANGENMNSISSELTYDANWSGVFLKSEYEENKNVLPVSANRDSYHFRGNTSTYLEFGPTVVSPPPQNTTLWWWEDLQDGHTYWPNDNSGNLAIKPVGSGGGPKNPIIRKVFPIGWSHDLNRIKFDTELTLNIPSVNAEFRFGLKYSVPTSLYDRYINNDGDDGYEWVVGVGPPDLILWSEFLERDGSDTVKVSIDLPRPGDEYEGDAFIEFIVYEPNTDAILQDPYWCIYGGMKIDVTNQEWEGNDYEHTSSGVFQPIVINPLGAELVQTFSYKWGITNPDLPNGWVHHLSAPYYADGLPMQTVFYKTGSPAGVRSSTDWLIDMWQEDNYSYTPRLKARIFEAELTPLNLLKDFEDRILVFVNGVWNDRAKTWEAEYTQAKWIRNIPGEPTKGDFHPAEFNDDFYTETI